MFESFKMLKYIVFMLFVICLQKAISDELARDISEDLSETPTHRTTDPIEINDDDEIDPVHTREIRTDLQTIVNCGTSLSEPLSVKKVTAKLATLDYKLSDVVVTNISKCEIKDLKANIEDLDLDIHLYCPYLSAAGKYSVDGVLIILPISGYGDFFITSENNGIILKTKLRKFTKKSKTHIKIKNYTVQLQLGGPVVYKLGGLFGGNEIQSTEAHKYINSNWKVVTELVQDPLYYAVMKYVLKNVNLCMKPVTIDNLDL